MMVKLDSKLDLYNNLQKEFNLPNELVLNIPLLSIKDQALPLLLIKFNSITYLPFYFHTMEVKVNYFQL